MSDQAIQDRFDNLLDHYDYTSDGVLLVHWATKDLVELQHVIDAELQRRAPPTGGFVIPGRDPDKWCSIDTETCGC